jgi:RNA polymerase sigma factor (sigma-70 family)
VKLPNPETDGVFDLRVESRFKNALLYKALRERFQATAEQLRKRKTGPTPILRVAAEITGVSAGTISDLLCLNASPFSVKHGNYKSAAIALAEALDHPPGELFPASLYALKLPKIVVREFSSPQVISLQEAAILHLLPAAPDDRLEVDKRIERDWMRNAVSKMLDTLKPRYQTVIRMRLGIGDGREHTLDEVGARLGISRERVRQIECLALRSLRDNSPRLREYLAEEGVHETPRL